MQDLTEYKKEAGKTEDDKLTGAELNILTQVSNVLFKAMKSEFDLIAAKLKEQDELIEKLANVVKKIYDDVEEEEEEEKKDDIEKIIADVEEEIKIENADLENTQKN